MFFSVWSDGDSRLLLDLYGSYLPEIGPLKKFKNKKDMWSKISSEIPNMSPKQCEERYKTILKRKKSSIDNNSKTGAKRMKVDYEDELNKICSLDDSIEPEIQISSQKKITKEKPDIKTVGHKVKKKLSVHETLLDIAEKKEEAKERRHKEKMEEVKSMKIILQKILEDKNNIQN